jgi:hypothetical protein
MYCQTSAVLSTRPSEYRPLDAAGVAAPDALRENNINHVLEISTETLPANRQAMQFTIN